MLGRAGLLPAQQKECIIDMFNFANWAGNKPALPVFLANKRE